MRKGTGKLLISICALGAMLAPSAEAVLAGENGRIAFISGREAGNSQSRGYLLPVPFSTGGGTISSAFTPSMFGQARYPTWSPDRTKIAFAAGGEIWIADLSVFPAVSNPVQLSPTESPTNLVGDRPAWSPDGTRIAYEYGSGADRRIVLQSTSDLTTPVLTTPSNLTPAGGNFEGQPAWSPNSQTVFYHRGNPETVPAANTNIYSIPAGGGTETLRVTDSGINEFQPAISPNGDKICFTLAATGGFNDTADVAVADLTNPPSGGLIVANSAVAEYNCTWSPDGVFVAYAAGAFGAAALMMERADNSSLSATTLENDPGGNDFDGNPDWAPDGRPDCPDQKFAVQKNTPLTFQTVCNDTGPAYEQTDVKEFYENQPQAGTLDPFTAGEPFTYTPPQGFTGEVTFQIRSFDFFGFGADTGTVTLGVGVINGTNGDDVLTGTPGPDTIRCGKGNDVVFAGKGNDRIFCGGGKDKVFAGKGNDQVFGQNGNDKLFGQNGKDLLNGGKGRDKLKGGPGGDNLKGGPGRDTCTGNAGRDRARGCEIRRP